jgi:hypothetical protein
MKLNFKYDKEKDVWCLLNKGKSSSNSQMPTKVYEQLVASCGENPTAEETSKFIDGYISEKNIKIDEYITECQKTWDAIADKYQSRAEQIFKAAIPNGIVVHLTINNRCPYDIEKGYFFVSMSNSSSVAKTIMHELWHFYTWYGLGAHQLEKLGSQKYNDLKEALTVLLNIEYEDLLPSGVQDEGYPQHKALREKVIELWSKDKDIHQLWDALAQESWHQGLFV